MHSCPHCGIALTAKEAGASSCPACRQSLAGRISGHSSPAETGPPPFTPSADRPALHRRFFEAIGPTGTRLLAMAIMAAVIAAIALGVEYYQTNIRPNVWIYVDNGDRVPLTVTIDAGRPVAVGPGQLSIIKTRDGQRRIRVTHDSNPVFDQSLTLEAGNPQRYILNPDGKQRYWIKSVKYGMVLPEFREGGQSLDSRYSALAQEVQLIEEPGPWIKVAPVDLMMNDDVPKQVEGLVLDHREAVRRISLSDYNLILGARKTRLSAGDPDYQADIKEQQAFERAKQAKYDQLERCIQRILASP